MAEPFLGQVTCYGFNYAPKNWALCQGQILSISQYTALFSLLGTSFGGNGQSNFGLPNLQGSVPIAYGQGPGRPVYAIGETGGQSSVTVGANELGPHGHAFNATSNTATATASQNNQFGKPQRGSPKAGFDLGLIYSPGAPDTRLAPGSVGLTGGGGAHNNMQPYLALNYCIALVGIFPSRS